MIPELHQLFWKMTGENVASTFFHAITREGTYCNHLTGVAGHPEFQCFKKMPVLLIADQRCSQIVVWGIDRVKEGYGEWADERVSYHFFPNYFCSDSTRHSPVYYLLNISDAVRQFFSHAPVPCRPQVMTVLQTNSNIWNYEQMTNEWSDFQIHVIRQEKLDVEAGWPAVLPEGSRMEPVFAALCNFLMTPGKCHWLFDRTVEGLLSVGETIGDETTTRKRRRAAKKLRPSKEQLQEAKEARRYTELTVFDNEAFMKWCREEKEVAKRSEQDEVKLQDDDEQSIEKGLDEDGQTDLLCDGIDDETETSCDCESDDDVNEADCDSDESVYDEVNDYVPDDICAEVLKPYRHPERMTQKLVGMKALRDFIQRLTALTQFQQRVSAVHPHAKFIKVSLHSVFMGPAGTGKTTAARLMGSFFRQAGALSRGQVVVCGMQSFTGLNFGCEEAKVHQLLDLARGGVLFIDEAYQLQARHPHDPLHKVLLLMLSLLADENIRDVAVILAGYETEMEQLLSTNPGLRSRFPNRFVFAGFSYDELVHIAELRVQSDGFYYTPDAWEKLCDIIRQAYTTQDKEFGNGRYVANLLDFIYLNHAQRCMLQQIPDEQLLCITASDVSAPPSSKPAVLPHPIGFCA